MGRRPRVHAPDAYYHVTLRGNHREAIFRDERDRALLDEIVVESLQRFDARAHAYCWMTNHIHLLVQVGDEPLSRVMHQVAFRYARAFQSSLPVTGHLFERRHHAVLVERDSHLIASVIYIHLNPVWAGIVSDPAQYPWSSHAAYSRGATSWVTTHDVLAILHHDCVRARLAYDRIVQSRFTPAEPAAHAEDPDVVTPIALERLADAMTQQSPTPSRSLEDIVQAVCARAGVDPSLVPSATHAHRIVAVRAAIAREALAAGACTMTQIAERLGRSVSAVSRLVKRYDGAR
jgi:REP element-mobilizing transposase RayT